MGKSTSRFVMLPWLKGLDTSTDEGIMQFMPRDGGKGGRSDFLREALDIIFDPDGSKVKRDGFEYHDNAAITNTPTIVAGHDYWANITNTKTQKLVVFDNQATSKAWFQSPSGGGWTELAKDGTATAPTNLKRVSFEVFNDDLIMALTDDQAAGRTPVKWNNQEGGNTYKPLAGTPPNIKFVRKHQGRIWAAGDPTRPDRLYFTSPGNAEEWSGLGDSGAIDIDPGDGDHSGITAIFPSFRGMLFVAKANALYRVSGQTPLDYKVEPVTYGLGCISHNSAIAVDMDDVYFASERGFHSLVLTDKFGDFEGSFLSADIQNDFKALDDTLNQYIQGVWIPSLNSCIWAVSRNGTRMDQFWLYDVRFKAWYKWTGGNPTALFRVEDVDTKIKRAYFGNNSGRLSKTQKTGIYHDYTNTAIVQTIQTPFIYPDGDPATIKGMKKLGIWCKMPEGMDLDVEVRLAGVNTPQTLTFTSTASGTPKLDVDFIMGLSELDADEDLRMTPYTLPIDGFASSVQLAFVNGTVDEYCAIFGFWIEWEPAGDSQETVGF